MLRQKGFTLIEIIISVTILGIMISLLIFFFDPIKQIDKAKTAQRENDIKQIQNSLDTYYNDHDCYPQSLSFGQSLQEGATVYFNKIPQDPDCAGGGSCYQYVTDTSSCPQWNVLFSKITNRDTLISPCPLEQIPGCLPSNYYSAGYGFCSILGNVDCAYISSSTIPLSGGSQSISSQITPPSGGGGSTSTPTQALIPPGPIILPTSSPTPTTAQIGCDLTISPGQSISTAIGSLTSNQTLCIHGGTYTENINKSVASGVTIKNYPTERPIIVGLLWLSSANNVTVDGINVTWNLANSASQHMVKFSGGSGWIYKNSEVWGAHSFAGILVSGGATNFTLSNLYVHDTYPSNSTNQDHLVYINGGDYGLVERSLFVNSTNGRGIKLGPPSAGTTGPGNIIIRYNTFYNNTGPSNIQLSYGAHDNQIYRNIADISSQENITDFNVNGTGNTVHDNVGFDSSAVASSSFDTGGNLHINPQFTNPGTDFHPLNSQAQGYGKYAP